MLVDSHERRQNSSEQMLTDENSHKAKQKRLSF